MEKERRICRWTAGKDSERGLREVEREEEQGTYFPVYPNLRDAERMRTDASGKQRERKKGKVGEETRASYCD